MRLIDADAFKEAIGTDTKIREVLCEIIDTRPTAFDLEKVVAELEREANLQNDMRKKAYSRCNVAQANIHRYAEQCYKNTINIVKGGIE